MSLHFINQWVSLRSILWRATHRELKPYTPPCQLLVHLPVRIEPIIHPAPLLLIQHDLQHLTPVLLRPDTLPYDLNRVHDISQDGVVDSSQGSGTGPLLGLVAAAAVGAFWAWQDAAGREDEDVAVGELLFELARQALLDFVEAWEEGDGDEDDDGFFAVADFDLERRKRFCQLGTVDMIGARQMLKGIGVIHWSCSSRLECGSLRRSERVVAYLTGRDKL